MGESKKTVIPQSGKGGGLKWVIGWGSFPSRLDPLLHGSLLFPHDSRESAVPGQLLVGRSGSPNVVDLQNYLGGGAGGY